MFEFNRLGPHMPCGEKRWRKCSHPETCDGALGCRQRNGSLHGRDQAVVFHRPSKHLFSTCIQLLSGNGLRNFRMSHIRRSQQLFKASTSNKVIKIKD